MKRYAVLGHPIGHSLSPLMHNTAFKLLGLDCIYELIDIDPANLEKEIDKFKSNEWGGFNVTVPHKEAIIPLLDEIDSEAQRIGAVNTVVIQNNKMKGYNTDIIGVKKTLENYAGKIDDNNCVIIGSGGAARSVVYVLTHNFKPSMITFIALYPEQAFSLAEHFKEKPVWFKVVSTEDKSIENIIKNSKLIVNASPVGMYPKVDESPVPDCTWFSRDQVVFDLVYRPLETKLLKDAKSQGAITIGGLEMFIQQGASAFKIWTQMDMPIDKIRSELIKELL